MSSLATLSAVIAALFLTSPLLLIMWLCCREVLTQRVRIAKYKAEAETDKLARYFIGTFRDNGFLNEEIIKVLGCKRKSHYYGIEDNKTDRAAASRALKILQPTKH